MKRSEFRQRMYQFKQARESNPQLSYWEWKNSLPDNLAHTPDWQYNNFGAYTGGLKPELNEDGYYHLGSRNPYTGEILKPKSHPTYDKAIQNDVAAGYFPYEKNGITYTKTYSPTGDISGYANGTDGVQSNTSEIPVTYSNGKWNYGYNPGAGLFFLPNIASKPVKKIIKKLSLDDVKDWSDDIWDDYYNHAITNNNAEEAQHLRDLHFKSKAPNTKYDGRLYRGVTNANPIMDISKMEVLDVPGVYTTPYKKYAQSYADADDRVVFNLYGNIENPWIDTFDKKYSFLHPERVKVRMGKYKDKGNIERYNRAKEQYDAIKNTDAAYRFLYDTPNEYKSNALPQEIIIRDPNKVKSANPITYDDNGEIIPLSKRDNFNSPDIRYGLIPLLGFGLYNKYNKNKENKSN